MKTILIAILLLSLAVIPGCTTKGDVPAPLRPFQFFYGRFL